MFARNTAGAQAAHSVIYKFGGFFQPVDNLPMLNAVRAGSAIPVTFSLAGNQGLSILAANYPQSQQVACDGAAPSQAIFRITCEPHFAAATALACERAASII